MTMKKTPTNQNKREQKAAEKAKAKKVKEPKSTSKGKSKPFWRARGRNLSTLASEVSVPISQQKGTPHRSIT